MVRYILKVSKWKEKGWNEILDEVYEKWVDFILLVFMPVSQYSIISSIINKTNHTFLTLSLSNSTPYQPNLQLSTTKPLIPNILLHQTLLAIVKNYFINFLNLPIKSYPTSTDSIKILLNFCLIRWF